MDFNKYRASITNKKDVVVTAVIVVAILLGFMIFNNFSHNMGLKDWTLVIMSENKRTEISGYPSGRECVEKALTLTKEGDYFNCGYNCVYDYNKVDWIKCSKYCGRGGCASVN